MTRAPYDWQLPAELEARLSYDSYGPQRTIHEAEHLLIVLHRPPDREHIVFLRTPDGRLYCNGQLDGKEQLDELLASYRTIFESCEADYEKASNAADLLALMERISPLNRSSTNLLSTLESGRELYKRDRVLIGARDQANEISRSFDLLFADTKNALDYQAAKSAEEQAAKSAEMIEAQHKLNILAAFTFPVMALATLFGMNLTSGLEEMTPFLFWASLGLGVVIGFLIKAWVLNQRPKPEK